MHSPLLLSLLPPVMVPMSPHAAQGCLLSDFRQASGIVLDCSSDSMQPVGQTLRDQLVILVCTQTSTMMHDLPVLVCTQTSEL